MKAKIGQSFGFAKTTAIGGVIFLLPLVVLSVFLGYVYNLVVVLYDPLQAWLPDNSATGIALLFSIAILVLLILCFSAGLMAQVAIGKKFSNTVENQLITFFPKYAIYKDIIAGNIGGNEIIPTLKPVRVRLDDCCRLGFESDRLPDGMVIVFFPGSPDPWIGTILIVSADRVEQLDISFPEFCGIFERLGRNSAVWLPVRE